MHKPLFLLTAGSVAAVGGLIVASAMPAGAATAVLDAQATTCTVTGAQANGTPCTSPDNTPVTFTITSSGVLAITAPDGTPDPVDLGSASGTASGIVGGANDFGPVTVTDSRGYDPADWTATVSSTAFTNTVTSRDVIPAADATYAIPTITADTASGLPLATGDITNVAGTLGIRLPDPSLSTLIPLVTIVPAPVVAVSGYPGDNSAAWSPTITVAVPTNTPNGTYDGTVTHSVT